jgi:hypothetical protein
MMMLAEFGSEEVERMCDGLKERAIRAASDRALAVIGKTKRRRAKADVGNAVGSGQRAEDQSK